MQKAGNFEYIHTHASSEEESEESKGSRDTTKVYFFIIAIIALLATNIYFYLKYQSSGEAAFGIHTERVYMRDEIDRIEAEVNRLTSENMALNVTLKTTQDSMRMLIADLRGRLSQQNITHLELQQAQVELDNLRAEVVRYKDELSLLKSQHAQLLDEKKTLQEVVAQKTDEVSLLEERNLNLTDQLKSAAVLKLSNMSIVGIRERSRNREAVDDRARRIDKFRIQFSIVDNPLVEPGPAAVYLRVIDPSGNLSTSQNLSFELLGNPMQYTDKATIEFTNQGESYTLEWVDPDGFKKGTYTIVLYTEDSTMGRSSIILN